MLLGVAGELPFPPTHHTTTHITSLLSRDAVLTSLQNVYFLTKCNKRSQGMLTIIRTALHSPLVRLSILELLVNNDICL